MRAGLLTEAQAFEEWMRHWKAHLETPGRLRSERRTSLLRRVDPLLPPGRELGERGGELLPPRRAPRPRARPDSPPRDGRPARPRRGLSSAVPDIRREGPRIPAGGFRGCGGARRTFEAFGAALLRPQRARHRDAGSRAAPRGRGPEAARGARNRGGRDGRDGPAPQGRLRLEDEGRGRAARRGGGSRGRAGPARGRERGRRARGLRRAPRGRGADRPAREGTQAGERRGGCRVPARRPRDAPRATRREAGLRLEDRGPARCRPQAPAA